MKILSILNPEKATQQEVKKYEVRYTARAIVYDEVGKIALLHVKKSGFFKLPGGGVEEGESIRGALERECMEEIGSQVEIVKPVGKIIELRKIFSLKQISYCYIAKTKGNKGVPVFTSDEIEDEYEDVWMMPVEAYKVLSQSKAKNIEGKLYIVPRETLFLKEALKINSEN